MQCNITGKYGAVHGICELDRESNKSGAGKGAAFVCYHKFAGRTKSLYSSAGRMRVRKIRKKEKICKKLLSICEE